MATIYTPKVNRPIRPTSSMQVRDQMAQQRQREWEERTSMYSLFDPLFNKAAKERISKGTFYENWGGLAKWYFSQMHGYADLFKKNYIEPITNPGRGLYNNLRFLGDTLDVVSNLVKAPIYAYNTGTDVGEAYKMAYGFGESGRHMMDYSVIREKAGRDYGKVGNFVHDMALEFFLDPANWGTLGMAAVGKAAVNVGEAGLKSVTKKVAGEIGQEMSEKAMKRLSKDLGKAALKSKDEFAELLLKKTMHNKGVTRSFIDESFELINKGTRAQKAYKFFQAWDDVDNMFTKATLHGIPAYTTFKGVKFAQKSLSKSVSDIKSTKFAEKLKNVYGAEDTGKRFEEAKKISQEEIDAELKKLMETRKAYASDTEEFINANKRIEELYNLTEIKAKHETISKLTTEKELIERELVDLDARAKQFKSVDKESQQLTQEIEAKKARLDELHFEIKFEQPGEFGSELKRIQFNMERYGTYDSAKLNDLKARYADMSKTDLSDEGLKALRELRDQIKHYEKIEFIFKALEKKPTLMWLIRDNEVLAKYLNDIAELHYKDYTDVLEQWANLTKAYMKISEFSKITSWEDFKRLTDELQKLKIDRDDLRTIARSLDPDGIKAVDELVKILDSKDIDKSAYVKYKQILGSWISDREEFARAEYARLKHLTELNPFKEVSPPVHMLKGDEAVKQMEKWHTERNEIVRLLEDFYDVSERNIKAMSEEELEALNKREALVRNLGYSIRNLLEEDADDARLYKSIQTLGRLKSKADIKYYFYEASFRNDVTRFYLEREFGSLDNLMSDLKQFSKEMSEAGSDAGAYERRLAIKNRYKHLDVLFGEEPKQLEVIRKYNDLNADLVKKMNPLRKKREEILKNETLNNLDRRKQLDAVKDELDVLEQQYKKNRYDIKQLQKQMKQNKKTDFIQAFDKIRGDKAYQQEITNLNKRIEKAHEVINDYKLNVDMIEKINNDWYGDIDAYKAHLETLRLEKEAEITAKQRALLEVPDGRMGNVRRHGINRELVQLAEKYDALDLRLEKLNRGDIITPQVIKVSDGARNFYESNIKRIDSDLKIIDERKKVLDDVVKNGKQREMFGEPPAILEASRVQTREAVISHTQQIAKQKEFFNEELDKVEKEVQKIVRKELPLYRTTKEALEKNQEILERVKKNRAYANKPVGDYEKRLTALVNKGKSMIESLDKVVDSIRTQKSQHLRPLVEDIKTMEQVLDESLRPAAEQANQRIFDYYNKLIVAQYEDLDMHMHNKLNLRARYNESLKDTVVMSMDAQAQRNMANSVYESMQNDIKKYDKIQKQRISTLGDIQRVNPDLDRALMKRALNFREILPNSNTDGNSAMAYSVMMGIRDIKYHNQHPELMALVRYMEKMLDPGFAEDGVPVQPTGLLGAVLTNLKNIRTAIDNMSKSSYKDIDSYEKAFDLAMDNLLEELSHADVLKEIELKASLKRMTEKAQLVNDHDEIVKRIDKYNASVDVKYQVKDLNEILTQQSTVFAKRFDHIITDLEKGFGTYWKDSVPMRGSIWLDAAKGQDDGMIYDEFQNMIVFAIGGGTELEDIVRRFQDEFLTLIEDAKKAESFDEDLLQETLINKAKELQQAIPGAEGITDKEKVEQYFSALKRVGQNDYDFFFSRRVEEGTIYKDTKNLYDFVRNQAGRVVTKFGDNSDTSPWQDLPDDLLSPNRSFIVFDFETTGTNADIDQIVQIAAKKMWYNQETGQLEEIDQFLMPMDDAKRALFTKHGQEFNEDGRATWYIKMNEGTQMTPGAQETHGLSPEFLNEIGATQQEVMENFKVWAEDGGLIPTLVAHNAKFDHDFLAKTGLDLPDVHVLDTLTLSRQLLQQEFWEGGLDNFTNDEIFRMFFGKNIEKAHDALYDVDGTTDMFNNLLGRFIKNNEGKKLSFNDLNGANRRISVNETNEVRKMTETLKQLAKAIKKTDTLEYQTPQIYRDFFDEMDIISEYAKRMDEGLKREELDKLYGMIDDMQQRIDLINKLRNVKDLRGGIDDPELMLMLEDIDSDIIDFALAEELINSDIDIMDDFEVISRMFEQAYTVSQRNEFITRKANEVVMNQMYGEGGWGHLQLHKTYTKFHVLDAIANNESLYNLKAIFNGQMVEDAPEEFLALAEAIRLSEQLPLVARTKDTVNDIFDSVDFYRKIFENTPDEQFQATSDLIDQLDYYLYKLSKRGLDADEHKKALTRKMTELLGRDKFKGLNKDSRNMIMDKFLSRLDKNSLYLNPSTILTNRLYLELKEILVDPAELAKSMGRVKVTEKIESAMTGELVDTTKMKMSKALESVDGLMRGSMEAIRKPLREAKYKNNALKRMGGVKLNASRRFKNMYEYEYVDMTNKYVISDGIDKASRKKMKEIKARKRLFYKPLEGVTQDTGTKGAFVEVEKTKFFQLTNAIARQLGVDTDDFVEIISNNVKNTQHRMYRAETFDELMQTFMEHGMNDVFTREMNDLHEWLKATDWIKDDVELMNRIKAGIVDYLQDPRGARRTDIVGELPTKMQESITYLERNGVFEIKNHRSNLQTLKFATDNMNMAFREMVQAYGGVEPMYKFIQNNPDYNVMIIEESNKYMGSFAVSKINIKSPQELQHLMDRPNTMLTLGDNHMYSLMKKSLDQKLDFEKLHKGTGKSFSVYSAMNFVRKNMLLPLKSMSLMSMNFTFGNIIDINLKNVIASERKATLVQDTVTAVKWYDLWSKAAVTAHETLLFKNYEYALKYKWFENFKRVNPNAFSPDEWEIIKTVDDFLKTPAAASETQDMLLHMMSGVVGKGKTSGFEKMKTNLLYGWKFSPFSMNMKFNTKLESYGRLALYINEINNGRTSHEALNKILKTHFNYGDKHISELYAEFVIPFISYPLRSFMFWMEALENPRTTRTMVDTFMLNWGNEELDNNDYGLYQMSRGNLNLASDHTIQSGITLNDAITLASSPHEAVKRKMNPLLKPLVAGTTEMAKRRAQMIPGASHYQALSNINTAFKSTGSVPLETFMPSIFNKYYHRDKQRSRYLNQYYRGNNFYKSMYTSTGKSRAQLRAMPSTPETLHYKTTDIMWQFR